MKIMKRKKGFVGIAGILLIIAVVGAIGASILNLPAAANAMETFESCDQLVTAFKNSRESAQSYWKGGVLRTLGGAQPMMAMAESVDSAAGAVAGSGVPDYSETNVQVEGVDEADIVKTDGNYIYTITQGNWYYGRWDVAEEKEQNYPKLVIAKAYPAEDAEIVSETSLGEFYPSEIFIHNDRLLVFGNTYEEIEWEEP